MKKENLKNLTISANDKLALMSNLSTMLGAGIPIVETIQSLSQESKGSLKKVLETVEQDLNQGQDLSTSFSQFPKIFNPVNVSILKSSEQSGTLVTTLRDLKEGLRRDLEFIDKVKSALLYPAILLVVFILMFNMILFFVIPRVVRIFSNLRVVLPLPTKVLIWISNLMTTHTLLIGIILLLITISIIVFYKLKKKEFLAFLSSFPIIRDLVRQIDLTRFSRNLSLLLGSGVPITNALELSEKVVISKDINKAIIKSQEIILSGGKLSEGLKDTKRGIPALMLKIIEAGEKSGTLDKSMQDISDYMDYNVTTSLKNVTTMIEPIILVVVGVFIGGVMISIIAPIYNLIGQINVR